MNEVIYGLFFISLGIWALFDQWYYVMDNLKGMLPVVMLAMGILSLVIVVVGPEKLKEDREHNDLWN